MADVSVRPARPVDAERIARVQLSTWRTAYADLLPAQALDVPEVQAAALWLGAVESPPSPAHRVLVAFDREELVGFAAYGPAEAGENVTTGVELSTLLVEPRWGRRGHGSRLVAAAVEDWRRDGAALVICWAFERDPATRSFLLGNGFEPDGTARGLDTGDGVAIQLRFHADLSA
ncbi:MAG: GNAT family N-acetyltransferase [Frankiales bacterium]|nr:GNAT family N-acetyltransferase [Frankiales bacterium]